jgi:3-phenylpropionate/trans-cinnamate dioxygenase ferredoxin subunit
MAQYPIGPAVDIPNGSLQRVELGGLELCLARTDDGELYAVDDLCTHEQASLSDGDLLGREIQCPLHNSRFDLATGAVRGLPAFEPTRTYQVTVGDDGIARVSIEE